jgi:small subunit ribosomal protein S13
MARIAGVDLPPQKRAQIGLTYIYGIGRSRATNILNQAKVDFNKKIRDLSEDELTRIRAIVDQEGNIEGDLRKQIQLDIKRLMDIGCYRGLRHRRSLPVRGQRTHTNARTRKGPRRATIAKKKAPARNKKGFRFQFLVFRLETDWQRLKTEN